MSSRKPAGTIPAALSASGQDVPPSPDVAALAQVIGQGVAFHVAQLLGPVLQRLVDVQEQPGCILCAGEVKRAERAYEVNLLNAQQAAEPEPEQPDVQVSMSFTIDPAVGPVCWAHFEPGE